MMEYTYNPSVCAAPGLQRILRQGHQKLEASLSYIVNACLRREMQDENSGLVVAQQ